MTIGGRNTEAIIRQINTNLSNNRKNYRTALHLITGHCGLNKYLHRINRFITNLCPACETDEETVSHFLGNCPATAELRDNIFTDYYLDINYIFNKYNCGPVIPVPAPPKKSTIRSFSKTIPCLMFLNPSPVANSAPLVQKVCIRC
jgi:hypothetical protein